MSYVVYEKETTRSDLKLYVTVGAAKAAITRLKKKHPEYKDVEFEIAEIGDFHENIEKWVERTNLMSGKKFKEPINTPIHCSPAFESYWSM